MRAADLGRARVAVWGVGREGRAAVHFLRAHHPQLPIVLLDDAEDAAPPGEFADIECAFGGAALEQALDRVDVLVKSPGVSLYRREIELARAKGVAVTSLLNLWFAERPGLPTICITGTKGKSTTAALLAHMLGRLGHTPALAGNIGVPVTAIDQTIADIAVIEVSSYQAADFAGQCDIAVLTSLFPEHLDWHRTLAAYYRDKLNLLSHSREAIANREAAPATAVARVLFNDPAALHFRGSTVFDAGMAIGDIGDCNPYLARAHNLSNLCAALTVAKFLGFDLGEALAASADFRGLPHRQQELGEIGGVLWVDDSISTAPEAALAALAVYTGRRVTLIAGGYDRGVDYAKLTDALGRGAAAAVICLGPAGARLCASLRALCSGPEAVLVASMAAAVARAREVTPAGGVVLLSPAAPSYGLYRDFSERGRDFAAEAGFTAPVEARQR